MTTAPDELIPFEKLVYPLTLLSRRHVETQARLGRLGPLRPIRLTPHSPAVYRKSDVDAYVRTLLADCGVPE